MMFGVYLVAFPVSRCHWALLQTIQPLCAYAAVSHTDWCSPEARFCRSHTPGNLSAGKSMRAKWLDYFLVCLPELDLELEPSVPVSQLAPSPHTLPPCRFRINIHDLP
jgi:hypothetical protein